MTATFRFRPLAGLAALSLAPLALAAESEGGVMDFSLIQYISALLAFGVVFLVLKSKVWPQILGGLKSREEKIQNDIEDAERARKQANAALHQYEKALAEARAEANRMLEQTRSQQEKVAAELKIRTEGELQQLREAAMRDIQNAKRAAIAEIYGQMASTATQIAGKILQRELNAGDQQRLVEQSLHELETAKAG